MEGTMDLRATVRACVRPVGGDAIFSARPRPRLWQRIPAALESLRIAIAFQLIGKLPVLANIEIGGEGGAAVTARARRLWMNDNVKMLRSPHLTCGVVVVSPKP